MDASSNSRRAATASVTTTPSPCSASKKIGRYRWKICALFFFATTMNYVDWQAVALLKPVLQDPVSGIGLTEVNYGYIVTAFSLAYALGLLVVGRFIDRAGTKIGYAVAVAVGPWAENWYPPPLANQEI
jgi:ACS family hexuronate transporter-like MFS transporter